VPAQGGLHLAMGQDRAIAIEHVARHDFRAQKITRAGLLEDVRTMARLLRSLGVQVEQRKHTIRIAAADVSTWP
jgi:UDP-N-acetylglucosamine enolpyruvyl transferase